ncbi:MAG TPA: pantoate--beta-alanine ligase [Thermomicrobiales bacterium]|nr:pantoate--beta-alanine ligase [Thermomicrobiales bacterium]
MRICTTIEEAREVRAALSDQLGFVPTMGALHAGHRELIRRARAENSAVAASIFVNPTQFTSSEDFQHYPRTLDTDLEILEAAGVDLALVPDASALYPAGFSTTIDVGPITRVFEGAARPGHFQGVATVVAILFNIIAPARAYFGQKDAQQVIVVRTLVNDLQLPIEIVSVPTVRDRDGLALSSRNARLTPTQRRAAVSIPRALDAVQQAWAAGERDSSALNARARAELSSQRDITVEYLKLTDPEMFAAWSGTIDGDALVLIAATLGDVRLIDNCLLETSRPAT